jgi:hypothetical protein
MWQLMEREPSIERQPDLKLEDNRAMFDLSEFSKALYGTQENSLCDLVGQCLWTNPDGRPKIRDLLDVIESELYRADRQQERDRGVVDSSADTLLVPGNNVQLKWASRLQDGVENVNRTRTAREPNTAMASLRI